jgi:hypothetical protein
MNEPRIAPHSYYPSDSWTEADDLAARARDAEWEANDPNMRALAGLGAPVRVEGETFAAEWAPAR